MGILAFIIGVVVGLFVYHYFLVPAFSAETPTYIYSKVVKVIDGDTIQLEQGDRIRLSVVNTPERWQAGYAAAKEFTTSLCLNKTALVDIDDKQPSGSYNRLVGAVYCFTADYQYSEPYFLNLALLTTGHAVVLDYYCDRSEFAEELCPYSTGSR